VDRRHWGGQRSGRHGEIRRRQNRRLPQLRALVDHGLLTRARLVYGQPALYVATRKGLARAGMPQIDPARVGVATTRHWAVCARLAVVLEACERIEVWGELRLRAAEVEADRAVASAQLGHLPDGRPRLRRPDLVLFPPDTAPVAVEAELSVKGARRLEAICRAWARCRLVSGVRYYAPPHVARAVSRAVSAVHAHDAVRILSIEEALKEARVVRFAA
jgi:hypothetical protein